MGCTQAHQVIMPFTLLILIAGVVLLFAIGIGGLIYYLNTKEDD